MAQPQSPQSTAPPHNNHHQTSAYHRITSNLARGAWGGTPPASPPFLPLRVDEKSCAFIRRRVNAGSSSGSVGTAAGGGAGNLSSSGSNGSLSSHKRVGSGENQRNIKSPTVRYPNDGPGVTNGSSGKGHKRRIACVRRLTVEWMDIYNSNKDKGARINYTSPSSMTDKAGLNYGSNQIYSGDACLTPVSTSKEGRNVIDLTAVQSSSPKPERKCLTFPNAPSQTNRGRDNAEGYLIVYVGDILIASSDQTNTNTNDMDSNNEEFHALFRKHAISSPTNSENSSGCGSVNMIVSPDESHSTQHYKVLGVLGQGTFAQVFKCINTETNKFVAIKIVKNKRAYVRQAAIEVDIFRSLDNTGCSSMVSLRRYFTHANHLCLVFDLLGLNLYEVLKRRQFRGLPLYTVQNLVWQCLSSLSQLENKGIVHCDLKPENILLKTERDNELCLSGKRANLALIDFGSACFEDATSHTYIQSRFYRSPEVLLGIPYDRAIDMWSLGCVSAELFLGLPILPGCNEHDQLVRITDLLGPIPTWMLEHGSKSSKYYCQQRNSMNSQRRSSYRLKTKEEVGGSSAQQMTIRYFKSQYLQDILWSHGMAACNNNANNINKLAQFVHFLRGILNPDPWFRWTAKQALQHPFFDENNMDTSIKLDHWKPEWDRASLQRRKMLFAQKQQSSATSGLISGAMYSPSAAGAGMTLGESMTSTAHMSQHHFIQHHPPPPLPTSSYHHHLRHHTGSSSYIQAPIHHGNGAFYPPSTLHAPPQPPISSHHMRHYPSTFSSSSSYPAAAVAAQPDFGYAVLARPGVLPLNEDHHHHASMNDPSINSARATNVGLLGQQLHDYDDGVSNTGGASSYMKGASSSSFHRSAASFSHNMGSPYIGSPYIGANPPMNTASYNGLAGSQPRFYASPAHITHGNVRPPSQSYNEGVIGNAKGLGDYAVSNDITYVQNNTGSNNPHMMPRRRSQNDYTNYPEYQY